MKRYRTKFIFCCLIPFAHVFAQDLHFSHFNEHHALINPALTGATSSNRTVMGYKNQWRTAAVTPYKTYGVSYESKLLGGSWKKSEEKIQKHRKQDVGRLGAGLSAYRDVAGEGDWSTTQVNLSLAAFVPTGHWSFLSAGVQTGFAFRRVDQTTLIFPNQYVDGGYSSAVISGESVPLDRYRFFDLASGVMWSYGYSESDFIRKKQTRGKIGFAAYHLTQPNLRTIGAAAENLSMRYVLHGDMVFSIKNSHLAVAPSFLFQMQGATSELILGSTVKYYNNPTSLITGNVKSNCLNFGLYYRTSDAVIMQFLIDYQEKYSFGFSYDLNISPLRKANKLRGGPEIIFRISPQSEFLYQKKKQLAKDNYNN